MRIYHQIHHPIIHCLNEAKKRKFDELESIDTLHSVTKNDINNNSNTNNIAPNATSITKKRKISTTTSSKISINTIIQPLPQKWHDKYKEYSKNIIKHYESLQNINNPNKSLFESEETQSALKEFQTKFASFIGLSTENNKIDIKLFNFDEFIGLISKLSYCRYEGLTDLSLYIRNILVPNNKENLSHLDIREYILKSVERKLYGINPISKSITKTEENMSNNDTSSQHWNKCRIYLWECLNMQHIPKKYQVDTKDIRNLNTMITKYGAFCKKFDTLKNKKGMKLMDKESALQKIDDGIVSWFSKQEQIEKQRLIKEEAAKKKKEIREQQLKEKREKKEKEEQAKKERMEQRQKQKEEKLKKEKERKERIEREKLERKQKKEQKELEKKQKELEKKQKQQEKLENAKNKKLSKTPQISAKNTKKKKHSILNFFSSTTPSNNNKTKRRHSMSSDLNSEFDGSSPGISPNKEDDTRTYYEKFFIKTDYSSNKYKDTIIAPIHRSKPDQPEYIQIDPRLQKVIISENIKSQIPKPTAIPSVIIEIDGNDNDNPIDLTLENDLSRMQIDDIKDQEHDDDDDIDMKHNNHKKKKKEMKLQWKYRFFYEDHRPSFFGVNQYQYKNELKLEAAKINIKKLCRSPFYKLPDIDTRIVDYDGDDSGVEYWEDEDGDDLDIIDDDEEEQEEEEIRQQGLLRADGFENDGWVINPDDDDEEALGDKDLMENIERNRRLKNKLKDEYPMKFMHQRQRGDQFNKPITISFPELGRIKNENFILYDLTKKKAVFMNDDVEIINGERDNDIKYLLELENKNNDEDKKDKDKDDKEKKKKKKKNKDKKDKKDKNKNKDKNGVNGKMECDDDEDDDIKMGGSDKPKLSQKNTLTHYFNKGKKQNKAKSNDSNKNKNEKKNENEDQNQNKDQNEQKKQKKKKKRIVMCELIE